MSLIAASCASVFPPSLEPRRCQLGIANCMLDVLVTEVSLQRSGIPSRVRLVEPAGMPQHVRVNLDFEPSIFAGSANQLLKQCWQSPE